MATAWRVKSAFSPSCFSPSSSISLTLAPLSSLSPSCSIASARAPSSRVSVKSEHQGPSPLSSPHSRSAFSASPFLRWNAKAVVLGRPDGSQSSRLLFSTAVWRPRRRPRRLLPADASLWRGAAPEWARTEGGPAIGAPGPERGAPTPTAPEPNAGARLDRALRDTGALDGNGTEIKGPFALALAFAAILFPFLGISDRQGQSRAEASRASAVSKPPSAARSSPATSSGLVGALLAPSPSASPALCAEKHASSPPAPSAPSGALCDAPSPASPSDSEASDPALSDAAASDSIYQELCADSSLQLFTGTAHPELAREIAAHLNVTLGRTQLGRYADGEVVIQILDEVRGKDVFVIQSTPAAGGDVHTCLVELFLLLTAIRRASAKRIIAVLPCMPYDRETELTHGDDILTPMAAADLAILLQVCGADGVMFVDIHNPRMEGFFTSPSGPPLPMTNIQPHRLAVKYFQKKDLVRPVVVATDNTAGEKAMAFWTLLKKNGISAGFTTMVCDAPKREVREGSPILFSNVGERPASSCEGENNRMALNHVGNVEGCDCIIVDDIIDTGEKAAATAKELQAGGARRIFMLATHGVLSKGSVDRINKSPIQEVVLTNTVPIPPHIFCEKLVVLSVGKLMAEAIKRVHAEESLSNLFDCRTVAAQLPERNTSK
ncbi:putative ribose-phosphate pyrophosphokinase [Neospora caninum Liverpool]|uniref:ribose-phosphate diphosphokinase n=1 Tax=Neospora caninum (strain Liverpool) TaxID=572307 RepID=F0VCN1_NEOCL|nr:putative ribose-phosphate pyrophosphokinase [Neospora caninum Liverpool]CBZ51720.1 putative ribose-phosphate pyrophosphokinase [Neospora caninum Liverpool]CEL65674.1 TPA: ribose-phosphate pyrophosphokinase, putative [Neospora caninum Liverpool]|eukprot:XP_003881753.1 putative ribose-phosphate pyrophosphokinase [Neospora caninum Liverpool]